MQKAHMHYFKMYVSYVTIRFPTMRPMLPLQHLAKGAQCTVSTPAGSRDRAVTEATMVCSFEVCLPLLNSKLGLLITQLSSSPGATENNHLL